jgi:hypothetical protein
MAYDDNPWDDLDAGRAGFLLLLIGLGVVGLVVVGLVVVAVRLLPVVTG